MIKNRVRELIVAEVHKEFFKKCFVCRGSELLKSRVSEIEIVVEVAKSECYEEILKRDGFRFDHDISDRLYDCQEGIEIEKTLKEIAQKKYGAEKNRILFPNPTPQFLDELYIFLNWKSILNELLNKSLQNSLEKSDKVDEVFSFVKDIEIAKQLSFLKEYFEEKFFKCELIFVEHFQYDLRNFQEEKMASKFILEVQNSEFIADFFKMKKKILLKKLRIYTNKL